ncbi:MAG: 5-formyltetrahydrofolate cyclo-ligase [Candidatus Eremiobacteraeota bacterium]|nr:5-formyltetrahydrofolate cyclo-ligase [Candidatus Eremiobacteraeota bacterium]
MKKELRKSYLERRRALTETEVANKSQAIFQNWLPLLDAAQHHTLHSFLSIRDFREVETSLFLDHLETHHPTVRIGVPRVGFESKELTHHTFLPHQLEKNSWGILEPQATAPRLEPTEFDMVLVPMLAFDKSGFRLGYGGGYYDKFLAQVRSDCLLAGVCFELGRLPKDLPVSSHDVPLDCVVTEKGVFRFPGRGCRVR